MPPRQRQFSQVRSNYTSRQHSIRSSTRSFREKSQFAFPIHAISHNDCVNCTNKNLALSKRQLQKYKKAKEVNQALQNIRLINSKRDFQKQLRQKMTVDASKFNQNQISRKSSLSQLKMTQNQKIIDQLAKRQQQYKKSQQQMRKSRRDLQNQYKSEFKNQLLSERERKQLQKSRIRQQNPQQVNNLKVLRQNQAYVAKSMALKKKVNQQNKSLIWQKSYKKIQQRESQLQSQLCHISRIESQFKNFSQFQSTQQSPYRLSRISTKQDVFTKLKQIETQRKQKQKTQRYQMTETRMKDLRKDNQQARSNINKKIDHIKKYVTDLTKQVTQRNKRQHEERQYIRKYQPAKSRVDYFTEELQKPLKPCNSCDIVLQTKCFGAK